ncbi:MAG TPA: hypothetical protein VHY58_25345 [Streptosporangiaceae bacterium]|jgi:hypothetical protein|nr:hypothetical protein [Streptosporangiaceae bacterium]
MFGGVANTLDRNVIIFLALTAAVLLLAGLCLAITAPPAQAQPSPRHQSAAAESSIHN